MSITEIILTIVAVLTIGGLIAGVIWDNKRGFGRDRNDGNQNNVNNEFNSQ